MILPNICKRMNLYYYFFLPEKSFRLGSFRVIQGHSMSFRPWISGHFELIQSVRSVKWLQTKVIWRWNVASDASYLNEFNGQNHGVRSYWVIWGHSETSSQTSAFFGRWKLEWFSSFIGFIFWFEVIWGDLEVDRGQTSFVRLKLNSLYIEGWSSKSFKSCFCWYSGHCFFFIKHNR